MDMETVGITTQNSQQLENFTKLNDTEPTAYERIHTVHVIPNN